MNYKEVISYFLHNVSLEDVCGRLGIETESKSNRTNAICQFHNDTKPSMVLYDDNPDGSARYKCFSCGANGNLFDLVQESKGIEFKEAVYWLAKEYNVSITNSYKVDQKNKTNLLENISSNVFEYTLKQFQEYQNKPILLKYLDERGYTKDAIEDLNICIKGEFSLVNHLYSLVLSESERIIIFDQFEKAGLVRKNVENLKEDLNKHLPLNYYYHDSFRNNRLIFPIRSANGELKGFSARSTEHTDKGPKYLFSKNLNKSNILYLSELSFPRLKKSRKEVAQLYICEGLFDAIRLYSLGFNAVSILGADLSDNQCKIICDLAKEQRMRNKLLEVVLFLDNDPAGISATSSAIKKLYKNSESGDLDLKVLHSTLENKVDPDSYLKDISNQDEAKTKLEAIEYPLPAIFLANELNAPTSLILTESYWQDISYSQRVRASKQWFSIFKKNDRDANEILGLFQSNYGNNNWFQFLQNNSTTGRTYSQGNENAFVTSNNERLNLSMALAKSSHARGGAFPDNTAEWRRIEMCTTAIELIITDRFSTLKGDLRPIEPLNTIYMSRTIGGTEARVMSIHCPEDLISHQYVMSELITKRHDSSSDKDKFSWRIPVTRFYRDDSKTETTGEGGINRHTDTLSFAYQIDMEVLEGREKPSSSGMFRPYFDCWQEFTGSINLAASKMTQVHMVRLDLKRYYDRLKRFVIKDALRSCLPTDFDNNCLSLFTTSGIEKRDEVIDWLLEQSFGYDKFNPETGNINRSDSMVGIPQGPDLSAFLANLVLFSVDSAARKFIESNKNETSGYTPVWYSRYVDDMVLIAEDATLLSRLRSIVEDAVKKLELEVISKEQPMPMSPSDFQEYLTKGKALSASGPEGNVEIIEPEDIEFNEKIERYQALGLLNSRQLYSDTSEVLKKKVVLAASAYQLRFTDLSKLTKWIWFYCIKQNLNEDIKIIDVNSLISSYIDVWEKVTANLEPAINPEQSPWEDPLLLAFDGLDLLLEKNAWVNDELSEEQINTKSTVRAALSKCIFSDGLLDVLLKDIGDKLLGGGISISELPRTYWQKKVNLLWHARASLPSQNKGKIFQYGSFESQNVNLTKSLIRTNLTECALKESNALTYEFTSEGKISRLCVLLQIIYYKLGFKSDSDSSDILNSLEGEVRSLREEENEDERTPNSFVFFNLLLADVNIAFNNVSVETIKVLKVKALNFICNTAIKSNVLKLLSSRWGILTSNSFNINNYTLIPPLPTVDETTIYGFSSISALQENNMVKVDGLLKLSVEDENTIDDIFVSDSELNTIANWNELTDVGGNSVSTFIATPDSLKKSKNINYYSPTSPNLIDSKLLKWTADTFEAILKCTKKEEDGVDFYRVPNWSNLSMSIAPHNLSSDKKNEVCILAALQSDISYSRAFIRDGSRGLRAISIPKHNSHIWQVGVALTDILGFIQDLDDYTLFTNTECCHLETPSI